MEEFNTNERELIGLALQEIAQKKEPVIMHSCHNCKFSEYPSYLHPCDMCEGFNCKGVGQELPGWEPENG